jgi:hypothetical protein
VLDRPPRPDATCRSSATGKRTRRAERQRRFRARQAARRIVVPVEVGEDEIGFLIKAIWLSDREAHDKHAIGAAISRLLSDSSRMD